MANMHSSEAFYAFDDPLDAAVFSVLVELMRELAEAENQQGLSNIAQTYCLIFFQPWDRIKDGRSSSSDLRHRS